MHEHVRHLVADALARSRASHAAHHAPGDVAPSSRLGAEALRLARLAAALHAAEAPRPDPAAETPTRDEALEIVR